MNCIRTDADGAARFLAAHDRFVILTHASPDGDTLGSGFALCSALLSLGKQAFVVCPDKIPQKFSYLVSKTAVFTPETVVAVDIADEHLLGSLENEYKGKTDLCIDHHGSNSGYSGMLYLDAGAAAACECIYAVIKALGAEITGHIADCLYTGIATDTGCFKFSNTTPRTHRIAAGLMELGADYSEINRIMFESKPMSRIAMERLVLENIEFLCDNRVSMITVTQKMLTDTGCDQSELDGITAMSRQIEGVLIGITIKEKEDGRFKVSVRTFEPYDASAICAAFGGGGHQRAAGCEFSCSLAEVIQALTDKVAAVLGRLS